MRTKAAVIISIKAKRGNLESSVILSFARSSIRKVGKLVNETSLQDERRKFW